MSYNPQIHHRRSIRLKGYDYTREGLYFITPCVQNRLNLFGTIVIAPVGTPLVGVQIDDSGIRIDDSGIRIDENGNQFDETELKSESDFNSVSSNWATTRVAPTGSTMVLNAAGLMVESEWLKLPDRFPNILLHEYVVMPNHFHAILQIESATDIVLGEMVGAFKSIVTNLYISGVKELGWQRFEGKLWQRNFYESIIRNDTSYIKISEYIINNPANWKGDKFYFPV